MPSRDPELTDVAGRLSRLPQVEPARDAWPAVRARLQARRRTRRALAPGLALAASLVIAVALGLQFGRPGVNGGDVAAAWLAQSQRLEQRLHQLDAAGGVLSGNQAAAIGELEDRIAAVDLQLAGGASGDQADQLLKRRVRLLSTLVALRTGFSSSEETMAYVL